MRSVSRTRSLAMKLARHAARVLPGASSPSSSPWAEAMRREVDHIADDAEAVRWGLGCVLASYRARLLQRPAVNPRTAWRQVAASGALMLVIGIALLDNAGGQTPLPEPAVDKTACDPAPPPALCRLPCAEQLLPEKPATPNDNLRDSACPNKSPMR
jgi:hypothetical protein